MDGEKKAASKPPRARRCATAAALAFAFILGASTLGATSLSDGENTSDETCEATEYEGCPGRWDYLISGD